MTVEDTRNVPRHGGRILPALLVIAVGALFLCSNLGIHIPFLDATNWWAWFILMGAAWPLSEAVGRYRRTRTLDSAVLHQLLSAAAIVMVALIFILQLSWGLWWPVFVIYGGLCMLVRDPKPRQGEETR